MEYAHLPTWDLNKTDEVESQNYLDPSDAAGDLDRYSIAYGKEITGQDTIIL